jgi:hypothetical protein
MTPEEIIKKCQAMNVYLMLVDDKIKPIGAITKEFLELSKEFAPYKEPLKKFLKDAMQLFKNQQLDNSEKIKRLQINCVNLGPEVSRPSNCNCNGKIVFACSVYGKCKRVGQPEDGVYAVCTECPEYKAP